MPAQTSSYRGRIAPSPTGELHLGHALTFWTAQERARRGVLVLRIEDLDAGRCRPEFRAAVAEDLRWFGIEWQEGLDIGGPFAPYIQSQRDYLPAWRKLRDAGLIYPCTCSRRDVLSALSAPHGEDQPEGDEPVYPGTCRHRVTEAVALENPAGVNWRFRVPDGETIRFHDGRAGELSAVAGRDFGDFIIWRKDNIPSYQLAVVADDAAMSITEVVRGEDLIQSTFRQILLYRALGSPEPAWYHCPLVLDAEGRRLAKRHASLSLRELRKAGAEPEQLRREYVEIEGTRGSHAKAQRRKGEKDLTG
jgi:glutamyl-tRNA synthetase